MITRFCLTCIFLYATFSINGQVKSMQLADAFMAKQQYFEAAVYFEKVLFETEDDTVRFLAITQKLQCLKQQNKFTEAIDFINENYSIRYTTQNRCLMKYEQMLCSYLAGRFENAVSLCIYIKHDWPEYEQIATVELVHILSLNELQKWNDARELANQYVNKYSAEDTSKINFYKEIPKLKSQDKGQTLSTIIPGAGQFYAAKPLEGAASILLQAASIYFGIYSFNNQYYLSAWLLGLGLFGSFHNGSARRAEVLVKQYNTRAAIRFNEMVKTGLISLKNK